MVSAVTALSAGSTGSGDQTILYGIPFHVVDTAKGQAKVPVGGCCWQTPVLV